MRESSAEVQGEEEAPAAVVDRCGGLAGRSAPLGRLSVVEAVGLGQEC
jgi:hypothetical protein